MNIALGLRNATKFYASSVLLSRKINYCFEIRAYRSSEFCPKISVICHIKFGRLVIESVKVFNNNIALIILSPQISNNL
jgi:hypothetical protein